ncbi:hypothetical protein UCDDA912_g09490 [Diaporthe ampelina]|uniref:Myb-like domain-containing protein n=1 Tax=Diaporthe ampelina TaxID=1214573 RepID=A0A0G2HQW0_9PEZI|nr:hypothetical protein UCDDA912_g09490 [Diaporthe ampelina]
MSSRRNLTIKGEDHKRIPISDCKLQPLNLLIPGGAPVMVPKDKAWPGAKKKEVIKLKAPLSASNSYNAEEEDVSREGFVATKAKSRRASKAKESSTVETKVKPEKKLDESCKKTTKLDKLATEAKQRKKLEQQVREQEKYIAKIKAKYAPKKHKHTSRAHEATESESNCSGSVPSDSTTNNASEAPDASASGALTDASEEVRRMIKSLKIRAAGTESADFNPSEDSQLLSMKENEESYSTIAKSMGRSKKQIQKRHRELMALGKTAETAGTSGPGETAEAVTTSADKDVPDDSFGGLFDLGSLQAKLEATAAEQGEKKDDDSDEDAASKAAPKASPVGILKIEGGGKKKDKKKNQNKAKLVQLAALGGESGYESGSEDIPTKAFIGSYASRLLTNRSTVPDPDDKFDEDDCILMALVEARRKGNRWKQMQADFANLTGRMVPVEVLKYKLGEGEKPEGY